MAVKLALEKSQTPLIFIVVITLLVCVEPAAN